MENQSWVIVVYQNPNCHSRCDNGWPSTVTIYVV